MLAGNPSNEVKHEAEVNNFAILKELKLFFMNKRRSSELQNCSWYNRVLETYDAELVYDEEERTHKLWVNDEPLEPQNAIQSLIRMIESLQSDAQRIVGPSDYNSVVDSGNMHFEAHAGRDVNAIINSSVTAKKVYVGGYHKHKHYDKPILDEATLNAKKNQALSQLKAGYSTSEYATISGIFGIPLKLEGQYINLQILCTDLKTKEEKESKDSRETKSDEKYKDARMASVEDLFGDKRTIKAESLFKPVRELFDNQVLDTKDIDEAPRLLLVQGRAGIGKTTFVHYIAHQWSKGQLYANYTWVFTLTLRKLRLFLNTSKPTLSEWVQLSQFCDWNPKEFDALWRQRIEPAINQNKVLLILDGYDEVPETHPCEGILNSLLNFTGVYQNLSLLVTSRPSSAGDITEKRRNLEIIGFTDENINQYTQTYFLETRDKTLVNTSMATLRKQPVIWANAHIPLNLNLLCGIMEETIKKTNDKSLNEVLTQLSSMTRLYQAMEKKLYERAYTRQDGSSIKASRQLMRLGPVCA